MDINVSRNAARLGCILGYFRHFSFENQSKQLENPGKTDATPAWVAQLRDLKFQWPKGHGERNEEDLARVGMWGYAKPVVKPSFKLLKDM